MVDEGLPSTLWVGHLLLDSECTIRVWYTQCARNLRLRIYSSRERPTHLCTQLPHFRKAVAEGSPVFGTGAGSSGRGRNSLRQNLLCLLQITHAPVAARRALQGAAVGLVGLERRVAVGQRVLGAVLHAWRRLLSAR